MNCLVRPRVHTVRKLATARNFISLTPPIQRISATRTLHHPSKEIYEIIADISSYSKFVPACVSSTVTKWSKPDASYGKKWPEQATLEIGWADIREQFRSNVYCVPGRIVESTSGSTKTRLPRADIAHHELNGADTADSILTQLQSRWTIQELAANKTQVALDIEFQFANPVYAAMSAALSNKVADIMIEAFEKRVKQLLD